MEINFKNKKIFAFADTHGAHRQLVIPQNTDILICAGDAVEDNLIGGEYNDFLNWFSAQSGKCKIFVPGNHELSFDIGEAGAIRSLFDEYGIITLEDAVDEFDGVTIGSISGNSLIADDNIPTDLDILVTHYPPLGVLDDGYGSPEILNFVLKAKPKYHLFGHIHATGEKCQKSLLTDYYNISCYESFN